MTPSLLCLNILVYSLQIAGFVALAELVSALLTFETPRTRLLYWQLVLIAALLLPGFRSWQPAAEYGNVRVTMGPETPTHEPQRSRFPVTTSQLILLALTIGAGARLILLGIGFRRLRFYRRSSTPLTPPSSWGIEADLRVSTDISSPVTFGWRHPVILLPVSFPGMNEAIRDAILCHEILHVRRRDWILTLAEGFLRSIFWFHPGIWWLLSEIQVAREQTVDRQAVLMTQRRDHYVDALLAMAGTATRVDIAYAPLFLRKRHLKRRVFSIFREVRMSRTRTLSALALSMGMLIAACWLIPGALPLQAAPQTADAGLNAPGQLVSLHSINIGGLPDSEKADLLAKLTEAGIRLGQQQVNPDGLQLTVQTIANTFADRHLLVQVRRFGSDQVDLMIATPEAANGGDGHGLTSDSHPIRLGAEVQAANILDKVPPVYPPLAKAARVQGTVKFETTIDKDGNVANLRLISGPPLLVQSATDAVSHWTYKPTLLNGEPVAVITMIDVNYTLSQ